MSKYQPLGEYLQSYKTERVDLTFDEMEAILGSPLPQSAYKYQAWWGNSATDDTHPWAQMWKDAGWEAKVALSAQRVVFEKLNDQALFDSDIIAGADVITEPNMQKAVLINGVFKTVLEEIVTAQNSQPDLVCYLQPYASGKMKLLADEIPSPDMPIPLYISLSDNLGHVCYSADIVGWENKQELSLERLAVLNRHIEKYQPMEEEIYLTTKGHACTNLISVVNMRSLPNPFSVSNLMKLSNSTPVGTRTQAGGWSYVQALPEWIDTADTAIKEHLDAELAQQVEQSLRSNTQDRQNRLANAPRLPERTQVVSVAYRRNADVIAEVLSRANGICERCQSPAPFLKARNGRPYLEIHHWILLSEGGEDTVENAGALCPNCHREVHFGTGDTCNAN